MNADQDKIRRVAEKLVEEYHAGKSKTRTFEQLEGSFERILREELAELLETLKIAGIFAPHNHEPSQDSNGHCPKCNANKKRSNMNLALVANIRELRPLARG